MNRRTFGVLFLLCGLAGCAADTARVRTLSPALAAAWPGVEADARLGVKARAHPQAALLLGVEAVDPVVARQLEGRLDEFGRAIGALHAP